MKALARHFFARVVPSWPSLDICQGLVWTKTQKKKAPWPFFCNDGFEPLPLLIKFGGGGWRGAFLQCLFGIEIKSVGIYGKWLSGVFNKKTSSVSFWIISVFWFGGTHRWTCLYVPLWSRGGGGMASISGGEEGNGVVVWKMATRVGGGLCGSGRIGDGLRQFWHATR